MDDKDLTALKDLTVPKPSDEARSAALQMAMASFEEAGKENATETQGSADPTRPTSTFIQSLWEWTMEKRMFMGTVAAGLVAVPVATHLFWNDETMRLGLDIAQEVREEQPAQETITTAQKNEVEPMSSPAPSADAVPESAPQDMPAGEKITITQLDDESTAGGARQDGNDQLALAQPPSPAKPEAKPDAHAAEPSLLAESEADQTTQNLVGTLEMVAPDTNARSLSVSPTTKAKRRVQRNNTQGLFGAGARFEGPSTNSARDQVVAQPPREENRDRFQDTENNPVKSVQSEPVSTFSIDVDTASYAFVRRNLENGRLPDRNAVRVEEMVNYFSYDYPHAETAEEPFRPSVALYPTPWNENTMLMHIGIKGHEIVTDEKPRSNLVFLIDVSGSMQAQDKLPLLKSAFRLLVDRLEPNDTVSIVTYAGRAGTVLEPTKVSEKHKILAALDQLRSGGSTAGHQGIRQAYALAEANYDREGINRVILATDGDFNVGISDVDQLKSYIEGKRKNGVYLSVLGFGQGNYNDHLMQVLAQNGNGNAAYIDSLREAQKVLVEEAGSTLFPIASDVKIQIEFNPALVSEYRLIGYETRALKREDFNNDKVDAGDIGSGHTVTAIYELTPAGSRTKFIDDLRYQQPEPAAEAPEATPQDEFAFLKLRYKLPGQQSSTLMTLPVTRDLARANVDALTADMRFAAAVAAFGQKLRGNAHLSEFSYDEILRIASNARGEDPFGYRSEFLALVRLAKSLDTSNR